MCEDFWKSCPKPNTVLRDTNSTNIRLLSTGVVALVHFLSVQYVEFSRYRQICFKMFYSTICLALIFFFF